MRRSNSDNSSNNNSNYGGGSIHNNTSTESLLPHQGALRRTIEGSYVLTILVSGRLHDLSFERQDVEFAQRLFAILDTENAGAVSRNALHEFCTLRCPVLQRRDEDLKYQQQQQQSNNTSNSGATYASMTSSSSSSTLSSPTFDEIWTSVVTCSEQETPGATRLGLEGWMVMTRFIALAQYESARRKFAARHLQQTMRPRHAPRGSEMVVVEVPPPDPPLPLTPQALLDSSNMTCLALPELDLDHSMCMVHDGKRKSTTATSGNVQVQLFGASQGATGLLGKRLTSASSSNSSSSSSLEFVLTYTKHHPAYPPSTDPPVIVRRSMADVKWLDDSLRTQAVLGGTLCGRILPALEIKRASHAAKAKSTSTALLQKTTTQTMQVAAAGVGKLKAAAKSAAKSIWGSYISSSTNGGNNNNNNNGNVSPIPSPPSSSATPTTQTLQEEAKVRRGRASSAGVSSDFYPATAPAAKARQLERYLNYLLEHPALSTSFPLNTILLASQSGLDAAKRALADCAAANQEIRDQSPDGRLMLASNLDWVRTAAQAAIALKIHGMLETTGMPAASARLQHASLPAFRARRWEESNRDGGTGVVTHSSPLREAVDAPAPVGFEDGVVQVSSELRRKGLDDRDGVSDLLSDGPTKDDDDDGYDLLPLPVPAPERRILMAGSSSNPRLTSASSTQEGRFHYGTTTTLHDSFLFGQDDESTVLLGSLSIDDNIDKLREVIGSVDNTLRRCLASGGAIGKARRDRNSVQLDVVKSFDGWEGMRGQFISQRSLLKGVKGLEQSKEVFEEGDLVLIDDLSWQSSLARSAVTAAEDVRSAVRASNTAANAKAAASNAAMSAQNACEAGNFANIEEARAAQTRASIAQSHAIHAAVVDHEAKSVKRRAAVALANDVKCWNVHRKRELLKSMLAYAKVQHEATRRAVDAWSCLRDGFIGSVVLPPLCDRRTPPNGSVRSNSQSSDFFGDGLDALGTATRYTTEQLLQESNEMQATIFGSSSTGESLPIVAVEHDLFQQRPDVIEQHADVIPQPSPSVLDIFADPPQETLPDAPATVTESEQLAVDEFSDDETSKSTAFYETAESLLPMATASPIPEEQSVEDVADATFHDSTSENNQVMSASMQSLVDGLMNWGGGIDIEEELVLPRGMAASIAFDPV